MGDTCLYVNLSCVNSIFSKLHECFHKEACCQKTYLKQYNGMHIVVTYLTVLF